MGAGAFCSTFLFSLCGLGGSMCCMFFSVWGIIMLGLLGLFFYLEAVALIEDIPPTHFDNAGNLTANYRTAGIGCFAGAGIYVLTFFLSLGFFIYDRVKPKTL